MSIGIAIGIKNVDFLIKVWQYLYTFPFSTRKAIQGQRYLKMSETYETEQAYLNERVKTLKSEIAKAKEDDDKILDFIMLIYKYNSFEEFTPKYSVRLSKKSLFTKKQK